ncbi:hypothetical protein [Streptomyces sp. CC210A]|uniref:hypothetical protein n=1 Tax=Streptomyces sp. CC210A TaxID=2898184 RepID=UPI001F2EE3AB|nr:hypothetical protein [Streptomyces sp. CC210A]
MQHSAAVWSVEIALIIRVFGPDAVRLCRRLLAVGVRIGISDLSGASRYSTAGAEDAPREVEQ